MNFLKGGGISEKGHGEFEMGMENELKQISAEKKELEKLLLESDRRWRKLTKDKTLNIGKRVRGLCAETTKIMRLKKKIIPLEKREKELKAKWEMREQMFDKEEGK